MLRPAGMQMPYRSGLALLTLSAIGCAAPVEVETGSSADSLSMASTGFKDVIREAEAREARCKAERQCTSVDETRPAGIQPLVRTRQASKKRASSFSMCEALEPLRALGHPYFFAGVTAKAAYVVTLEDGGIDVVFDLKRQQAAFFHYHNHGVQNLVGVDASAYMGWAFGEKEGVIDAWSGEFQQAEASLEVPLINISAGGSIFRSPDDSLWGGTIAVTAGLNLIPTPVELAVSEGEWTAWDAATEAYGRGLWFVGYDERSASHHGKTHTYLQFNGTVDLVFALLQTFGPFGGTAAAQAAALAALDSAGLTIDSACPKKESRSAH